MSSKEVVYPSFKDAQKLYSQYSTLQNSIQLSNILSLIVDSSYINYLNTANVRSIYNTVLLKYYPNEIVIKSSFINNVLLKHSDHVTIFELPVNNSRVDLCKINGKSTAFEIKTDLDNLNRLGKQLTDYLEIFEEVYVICSENRVTKIELYIPNDCGIYIYSISSQGKYKYSKYRQAIFSDRLSPYKQLCVLRKQDLLEYFPITNCKEHDESISNILINYNSEAINKQFKYILKSRYKDKWNFLRENHDEIYEIDYQWFFKNMLPPKLIYG